MCKPISVIPRPYDTPFIDAFLKSILVSGGGGWEGGKKNREENLEVKMLVLLRRWARLLTCYLSGYPFCPSIRA